MELQEQFVCQMEWGKTSFWEQEPKKATVDCQIEFWLLGKTLA